MKIIVADEKYGTRYYDASDLESWARSSLEILTERWRSGRWYLPPETMFPNRLPQVAHSRAEVEALPEGPIKAEHLRDLEEAERRQAAGHRQRAAYEAWFDAVRTVVEEQDAGSVTVGRGRYERQEPKAWRLLDVRSDYEYEHVRVEDVWRYEDRDDSDEEATAER